MSDRQATRGRLSINMTVLMRFALEDLAERNGLNASSQATMLLRQALERTMATAPVQARYNKHLAQRTAKEWRNEQTENYVIEKAHANGSGAIGTARK